MKNNHLSKSGVTLIELIIVVVVIGVLSTLAITKFTQGNYSEKARIARLNDYATKISASARHARDSDGFEALALGRQSATSQWNGAESGDTAAMRNYMTSIHEEVDLYIATPTLKSDGVTAGDGDTDDIWEFVDSDEVIVLRDIEINDLSSIEDSVWLVVDEFGEIIYYDSTDLATDYGTPTLIHD